MSFPKETIFFAYQGRPKDKADDNVDAIQSAIRTHNKHQKKFHAESWEDYKTSRPINKDVLEAIDKCTYFVCDLTYFNHNVLFELGYAIAKERQILILLNSKIDHAGEKYEDSFLKAIRYTALDNAQSITNALRGGCFEKVLRKYFIKKESVEDRPSGLFYSISKNKNQASLELSDSIATLQELLNFELTSDDKAEVAFRHLEWYGQSIHRSESCLFHFLGENVAGAWDDNARNSFWAGLALGLGREVLIVAPSEYRAPLDYNDILLQYTTAKNLSETVWDWIEKNFPERLPATRLSSAETHEIDLIKLGIGREIAEEERVPLQHYFVETASYRAALSDSTSIVVGRKGSGKSAIYFQLLHEHLKDPHTFVIQIKPESAEILQDLEMSELFPNRAGKMTFFFSVWKMLIFSKLALLIDEKIEKLDASSMNAEEKSLHEFIEANRDIAELNIFAAVKEICSRFENNSGSESPSVLKGFYDNYLSPLIGLIKNYFKSVNTKYCKVILLADNLDKSWNSEHNLEIQSDLLLTLMAIPEVIKKVFNSKGSAGVEFRQALFLRQDIFDYILKEVDEPDKLTALSHEINWEAHPHLLRRLVENRFKYVLDLKTDIEIENTWTDFFDFKDAGHPFDVIERIVTKRPRDIVYFVKTLFESAYNNGHDKATNGDLSFTISCYTNFINRNLIAEIRAIFPEAERILAKLQAYHGEKMEYATYREILDEFGYVDSQKKEFTRALFEKNYMVGFNNETNAPFSDIETLEKKLLEKRFFFFQKKVYVIAHAKYYFMKNKPLSSF